MGASDDDIAAGATNQASGGPEGQEGGSAGSVGRARKSLSEHYRDSLEQKFPTLQDWADSFDPADEQRIDDIRRVGHQMRGSGASFGFPGISDLGAAVEGAPVSELPAALGDLIAEVRRALVELGSDIVPDA